MPLLLTKTTLNLIDTIFAVRAVVQEGDPRNSLADAARLGDSLWSNRSLLVLFTTFIEKEKDT